MQRHQREKSVDLLNQPDMLSAFLGSTSQEDDWGATAYHGRTTSRHEFEEPSYVSENIEGDMAIPEPQPYTEPAPLQTYDSYASSPQEDLQDDQVSLKPLKHHIKL